MSLALFLRGWLCFSPAEGTAPRNNAAPPAGRRTGVLPKAHKPLFAVEHFQLRHKLRVDPCGAVRRGTSSTVRVEPVPATVRV